MSGGDDQFLVDVFLANGHPTPTMRRRRDEREDTFATAMVPKRQNRRPLPPSVPGRDFTSAAVHGKNLFITTLHLSREGELKLVPNRSAILRIEGRSQADVEAFYFDAQYHCFANAVERLTLRAAPDTGPVMARSLVYKMETVLQLVDGLAVDMVMSSAVSAWLKKARPNLPEVSAAISYADRQGQLSALETAAYLTSGGLARDALLRKEFARG